MFPISFTYILFPDSFFYLRLLLPILVCPYFKSMSLKKKKKTSTLQNYFKPTERKINTLHKRSFNILEESILDAMNIFMFL